MNNNLINNSTQASQEYQNQPPAYSNLTPEQEGTKKRSKSPFRIIIFVIIGVLIISGLAFAGWWAYDNYIALSPEKVLQKSVSVMSQLDAYSFDILVNAKMESKKLELEEPTLELVTSILGTDQEEIDLHLNGYIDNFNSESSKFKIQGELDLGAAVGSLGLESIRLDKNYYFKISQIPVFASMFFDTSQITDKWVKFEQDKDFEKLEEIEQNEDIEAIKKIIQEQGISIIKIVEDLGIEELDSVKTYHYKIGITKESLINLINNIKEVSENKEKIEESLADMKDEDWNKVTQQIFDVWIDKEDFYLRKFYSSYEDQETKSSVTLTAGFNDFNTPLNVVEPADVVTWEEFFNQIIGDFSFGFEGQLDIPEGEFGPGIESNDDKSSYLGVDSDNDGLDDDLEKLFGTDPANPDTDGDGYLDGEETENGYNPLGEGKLYNY